MEEGGGRKKKEKKKGKGRRRRKKGRRCLRRHVLFRCRRLLLRVHVPPTPKVYEPSRSGCRPSRRLCVDGLRAGIVDVWAIVPQMWTSAIVSTVFLAGYRNLPIQGRFCQNFVLIVLFFFFCRAGPVAGESEHLGDPIVFVSAAVLPAQRRLATAPTRHCVASLSPPPP